jgi:hypothetical protein
MNKKTQMLSADLGMFLQNMWPYFATKGVHIII